jgi:3-oxoacyl-[acyl-carrier protein] reductase
MNRNYLILGASSDVGVALINHLNANEKNVRIMAHYHSAKTQLEKIAMKNCNQMLLLQCDLSNGEQIQELSGTILDNGIPDTVIHLSAPRLQYMKFKDILWEDCIYDTMVQVGSVFTVLQTLLPKMIKGQRRAKVVLMLSENTIRMPAKFTSKYTMSKYMLLGLLKSLTVEYDGKNVNINALSPTMMDTKFLSNIDRRMLEVSGITERMLSPKDVVPYIIKLVSAESDNMYGENIFISEEKICKIE